MTTDTSTDLTVKAEAGPDVATDDLEQRREREAREEHNKGARRDLKLLIRSTTQGDWLAVCRGLSMTRAEIQSDEDLLLLAMAWVREKRQHGAASWEILLGLTDRGVLELHGFQLADDDELDDTADTTDNEG